MLDIDQNRDAQAADAEAYVRAAFGERLDLDPIAPTGLPNFMIDRYFLWQGTLLGRPLLLAACKTQRPGMADFAKHREILRRTLGDQPVILLLDHAPAAIRRRMVERRIGFLSPGSQLYIPEVLLDWRERGKRPVPETADHVTPTAQLVLLAALLGEALEDASLTELADRFQVAVMSMTRALDELEALQIAKAQHVGRQRRLRLLLEGRELWDRVKDRLRSPVRKIRAVRGDLEDEIAPRAGESALAHYTMLTAPRVERRAIAATRWRQLAPDLEDAAAGALDEDRVELETWSYEPAVLARDGVVDRLSLYLCTRHDLDERVAQAAEQLLEPLGW